MNPEVLLQRLLSMESESEIVEFKHAENNFDRRKLGKYFSALSNEANLKGAGCAWLVFGVDDKRNVKGTQFCRDAASLQTLKKEIADKLSPRMSFIDIHVVRHNLGRVILFEIPPAPRGIPVACDDHWYGRDGESLVGLSIEELERIRNQNTVSDWSSGICAGATLDDLSSEAITLARQEYATKFPNQREDISAWDDTTFLNKAKLCIKGGITRTALLLLGKPEASTLLNPASATLTWVLKDRDGVERDYEHFSCPLLISADRVFKKIRNLKYRYMSEASLFPDEVDQYDPFIIREALNNAIAHQDYELAGKISIVEFEDGRLCFSNHGSFIPGSVEQVVHADAPESRYRNRFLTDAMVNLNMIDTIGSGIRKMFIIQKRRYFPLPEYLLERDRVQVTITGRVLDMNYAHKLAELPDLSLEDIMLLDRVQKRKPLTDEQARHLKHLRFIEGRKPNYHISAQVATASNEKAQYIRNRGFDDQHYKQLIREYIEEFGSAKRVDIDQLLVDKLPDILTAAQKTNRVKNLLQSMKNQSVIMIDGKTWRMSKRKD